MCDKHIASVTVEGLSDVALKIGSSSKSDVNC